ncbi:MAG: NAD(P)/FAD-dependent oxidoreductase [Bacteroidota bacterium]
MKASIPLTNRKRVVIIGGGFGGIKLAKSLRKSPFQVVLLDKNNFHTFQPLLYQVATGGLEPDSVAFPLRKIFRGQDNFVFRIAEVHHISAEAKEIDTSIGCIDYDYLVLATGSASHFFGMDQVEKHSFGLKDVAEAVDLRSLVLQNFERALLEKDPEVRSRLMQFVVVGGGPTGVEMAGALAELKRHVLPNDYPELDLRQMEVHLIEAGPQVLGAMSEQSQKNGKKALEKMGVHLWMNTFVEDYDGEKVKTKDGPIFETYVVLWAAGIKGSVPSGIEAEHVGPGYRIRVDSFNSVVGLTDVYALGDVAYMETEPYPKGHPQVAPVAIQQAANLAKNLIAAEKSKQTKPFSYFDKGSMATVGRNKAVVDFKGFHLKGIFAWLAWMFVHLLFLIGFRNKLIVLMNWVYSYFTYDKGSRIIIRPFYRTRYKKPKMDLELKK